MTDVRIAGAPLGYVFAFANCALFVVYIVLGHRISGSGGIDRLGISMLFAAVVALPIGMGIGARLHTSRFAHRGRRCRNIVVGDPLRHRSTGNGAAAARHLRASSVDLAGDCHSHRLLRAQTGANSS